MQTGNHWLHRFAMLVVGVTLGLIFVGGLVTTKDAGMSVPDWPTSFHYSMFAVPFGKWLGPDAKESGVFYEHSHRLFAFLVSVLTAVLMVWLLKSEPRRWLKGLGVGAGLLVIAQAVLGGLRVTNNSVTLAMVHGCVAQAFLAVLVVIAVALSPAWAKLKDFTPPAGIRIVSRTAWLLVAAVYTQLIIGAVMRHLHAWGAIPTFPRSSINGAWVPPFWSEGIALNFAHRIGALVISLIVIALVAEVYSIAGKWRMLTRPANTLVLLVLTQIYLGSNVILKMHPPTITTLHVVTGASILAVSVLLALRVSRLASADGRGAESPEFSHGMRRATA